MPEEAIQNCPLPPRLSLLSVMRALQKPGGLEELVCVVEEIAAKKGIKLDQPITAKDVIGLANLFGLLAPVSEWLPGPGEYVNVINRYVDIDAGETVSILFCGSLRGRKERSRLTKFKRFRVEPDNLTAQENVWIDMQTTGSLIMKPWSELFLPSGCTALGVFDTTENFWLASGVSIILAFTNTHANSRATVHVTGESWETI